MASYISSAAAIQPKSMIGEHCFICEQTVIQPFAEIGDNVVIWSGNQICHRCHVRSNCFILPNCIVSDGVTIGENSIVGANVTIASDRSIGRDCFIGPATLIDRDAPDGSIVERILTGPVPEIPHLESTI
jgi:UDP-3-O-[3-hydroxymyristoyl] glucosamine N-acyltransferase